MYNYRIFRIVVTDADEKSGSDSRCVKCQVIRLKLYLRMFISLNEVLE